MASAQVSVSDKRRLCVLALTLALLLAAAAACRPQEPSTEFAITEAFGQTTYRRAAEDEWLPVRVGLALDTITVGVGATGDPHGALSSHMSTPFLVSDNFALCIYLTVQGKSSTGGSTIPQCFSP